MKKALIGFVVASLLGSSIASAELISFSGREAVRPRFDYDGPPVTLSEFGTALGSVGVGSLLYQTTNPMVAFALPEYLFLVWGAWRTDKYRPQPVKDRIRAIIAARESRPLAGTIWAE